MKKKYFGEGYQWTYYDGRIRILVNDVKVGPIYDHVPLTKLLKEWVGHFVKITIEDLPEKKGVNPIINAIADKECD